MNCKLINYVTALPLLIAVLCLSNGVNAEIQKTSFSIHAVNEQENVKLNKFLDEIIQKLPLEFKKGIDKKVNLEFENLNDLDLKEELSCDVAKSPTGSILWGQVRVGRFQKWKNVDTIYLDDGLLEIINNDFTIEYDPYCSHANLKSYVESIFIHELAHIYDHVAPRRGIDLIEKKRCQKKLISDKAGSYKSNFHKNRGSSCRKYVSSDTSVSDSPYLLNALGWIKRGLKNKRENLNQNILRSPNNYEFKNPKEAYAVNFEFFLLDETFKCRRPTIYNYFSHIFGVQPFKNSTCRRYSSVAVQKENISDELLTKVDIDHDRLYEVDYLFAGKGETLISRWGHAMFRLVICKKGRPLGPACRSDVAEHLVVSYRANMNEMSVDYTKGFNGGYSSQLLILPFSVVINEYTTGELREVTSLPLALTSDEKKRFLDAVLEQYWSYRGRYFFLSNNCATEALNLLKVAKFSNEFEKTSSLTPLSLYKRLVGERLIDDSFLKDMKIAQKKGYYYPPSHLRRLGAFDNLQQLIPYIKGESSEEALKFFITMTTVSERVEYYNEVRRLVDVSQRTDKIKYLSSIAMLEDFILQRYLVFLKIKLVNELVESKGGIDDAKAKSAFQSLEDNFSILFTSSLPENMSKNGYGIPLEYEFDESVYSLINKHTAAFSKAFKSLEEWMKIKFSADVEQMEQTTKVLKSTKVEIACMMGIEAVCIQP